MKNVLIITYDMLPYSNKLGSCQRMYFLAEYLQKRNFSVIVISCKHKFVNKTDFGYKIHFKQIAIPSSEFLIFLEKVYNYTKKKYIKLFKFASLNEPNTLHGSAGKIWLLSAKRNIKKVIISSCIDTVIISGPPFTLFNAVNFLKKYNGQIIVDYRDPWFDWSIISHLRKKESKILSQVNKVMVFSELFRNDLIKEYGLDESKCFAVYNGFNNDAWENYTQKSFRNINEEFNSRYINVTLTGSYSLSNYDPTSIEMFLKALFSYEHRDKFKITIAGIKRDGHIYWENKLKNIISFSGMVEHKVAITMMLQSDILLMAYPFKDIFTSRYMIMGKFMDYIKSKKPIWGIYKYPSEFSTMIDQYKLGITCINEEVEIKKCFDILLELKEKDNLSTLRDRNFDKEYFYNRDFQYDKFIENLS